MVEIELYMSNQSSYGWKDFLTDAAILVVVAGLVLLIVGSFSEFFEKLLPFLK